MLIEGKTKFPSKNLFYKVRL